MYSLDLLCASRCVNFVNEDSGRCVDSCDGVVILNMRDGHLAKVCTGKGGPGPANVHLASRQN